MNTGDRWHAWMVKRRDNRMMRPGNLPADRSLARAHRAGIVTLTITCDRRNATANPAQVTRWILKRLRRIFGVRVTACDLAVADFHGLRHAFITNLAR